MAIMSEDSANAFLMHRLDRNAIGQAVALVRTRFVEGTGVQKSLAPAGWCAGSGANSPILPCPAASGYPNLRTNCRALGVLFLVLPEP
jgi:hypothetical protein